MNAAHPAPISASDGRLATSTIRFDVCDRLLIELGDTTGQGVQEEPGHRAVEHHHPLSFAAGADAAFRATRPPAMATQQMLSMSTGR